MKLDILRGVSGSGKSTHAKELVKGLNSSIVCSADGFFMKDGEYNFDAKLLGQAHAWCKGKVAAALELGVERVVVDNTNTAYWEYEPYLKLGEEAGYEIEIHTLGSLDEDSLKQYANRNKHGVSIDIIRKQAKRFESQGE